MGRGSVWLQGSGKSWSKGGDREREREEFDGREKYMNF